jgi:hypothetical protein
MKWPLGAVSQRGADGLDAIGKLSMGLDWLGQNPMGFKRDDALSPKWRIGCKATQTVDPVGGRDLYVKGADKYRMSPFFRSVASQRKQLVGERVR